MKNAIILAFFWIFVVLATTSAQAEPLVVELTRGDCCLWNVAKAYTNSALNYSKLINAETGKPFLPAEYKKLRAKGGQRHGALILIPENLQKQQLAVSARLMTVQQYCAGNASCLKRLSVSNAVARKFGTDPIRIHMLQAGLAGTENLNAWKKFGKLPILFIALLITLAAIITSLPGQSLSIYEQLKQLAHGVTRRKLQLIQQDLQRRLYVQNVAIPTDSQWKILPAKAAIKLHLDGNVLDILVSLAEALKSYENIMPKLQTPPIHPNRLAVTNTIFSLHFSRPELARWHLDKHSIGERQALFEHMKNFAGKFFKEFQLPHQTAHNFMLWSYRSFPERMLLEILIAPGEGSSYPSLQQDNRDLMENMRYALANIPNDPGYKFTLLDRELREENAGKKTSVVIPFYMTTTRGE